MSDRPASLTLPPAGEVTVWWWPLDVSPDEARSLRALLSDDERARAGRFARPGDGSRFTVARGRLRQLLGAHVGLAAGKLDFEASPEGKPRLAGSSLGDAPGLRFNLSHSGGHAAAVIADGVEVGIDIEIMRPVERDLASRFFAPEEVATLDALRGSEWLAGFYRCWTRKEAVLKASGQGLGIPLETFAVSLAAEGPASIRTARGPLGGAEAWSLLPFQIGPDLPGAVAVASPMSHGIGWQGGFEPA